MSRPRNRSIAEGAPPRIAFVLPDVAAVHQVAGSFGHLAARKYQVQVGVAADPPGAPSLGFFHASYPGLTVQALPTMPEDPWLHFRTLARTQADGAPAASRVARVLARFERSTPAAIGAMAWLEAHHPDVLVVARLDDAARLHLDFLRAARARGIPTIFLVLAHDDVARAGLGAETPGCVAIWNRTQRRDAVDAGVPVRHTCLIGAHLATDVLETRPPADRRAFAASLGIGPERPVIVFACSGASRAAVAATVHSWNEARLAHPDERVRTSAVIVRTWAPDGDVELPLAALPGVVDVQSGAITRDFLESARRLHASLAHADVLVTTEPQLAIEGLARPVPVVAVPDGRRMHEFCAQMRREHVWPRVAESLDAQLDDVAGILRQRPERGALDAARGLVRPHGDEIEPGFLLVARLLREVRPPAASAPEPAARRVSALAWAARALAPAPAARLPAPGDRKLLLIAPPSAESIGFWSPLLDRIVARGHRVLVADGSGVSVPPRLGVRPVAAPVAVGARGWRGLAAGVELMLSIRAAPDSACGTRWRRLMERVSLPAAVQRFDVLMHDADARDHVRGAIAALDASLAASAGARRLLDREQPDAVILLPSLDPVAALPSRVMHADLARAARARGIPVADSFAGSGPLGDAIAQAAVRTKGLSHSYAEAIAVRLESWLDAAPSEPCVSRPLRALTAGLGIVGRVRLTHVMRAIEIRRRSLMSLASRARSATR